jgi:hypothetical protein
LFIWQEHREIKNAIDLVAMTYIAGKLFMVILGSLLYLMVGYERIGPEFAITKFSETS